MLCNAIKTVFFHVIWKNRRIKPETGGKNRIFSPFFEKYDMICYAMVCSMRFRKKKQLYTFIHLI